jgi:hypothetical protein
VREELFGMALADSVQARQLHAHGGYLPVTPEPGREPFSAQHYFMAAATARARDAGSGGPPESARRASSTLSST